MTHSRRIPLKVKVKLVAVDKSAKTKNLMTVLSTILIIDDSFNENYEADYIGDLRSDMKNTAPIKVLAYIYLKET